MSSFFYSPLVGAFYPKGARDIPDDALEVSQSEFLQLTAARNRGRKILVEGERLTDVDRAWTADELAAVARAARDAELMSLEWLRNRHRDQLDIGADTTLTTGQFAELLLYLQALRDWPQSDAFPSIEHRPIAPLWIADQSH